jgi:hypothetical protein
LVGDYRQPRATLGRGKERVDGQPAAVVVELGGEKKRKKKRSEDTSFEQFSSENPKAT